MAAAKLAREVAASFNGRKRFVAGSMGPTTKLPSLGHISFDAMAASYTEQAVALIEGGVDVLLLETCQDILQAKAGLVGIFDALKQTGKNVPVQVQVTLEATGTMLLGTEIGAALTTLEMFDVAAIGLNCATGPKEMNDARPSPGREFAQACLRAAQRRPAAERGRPCGLQADSPRSWPTITSSSSPNTACGSWAAVAAPRRST